MEEKKDTEWTCPNCSFKLDADECFMCGMKRPTEAKAALIREHEAEAALIREHEAAMREEPTADEKKDSNKQKLSITDKVYAVVHQTSSRSFEKILQSGNLRAAPGDKPREILGKMEVLNKGVFTQLIFQCQKTHPYIGTHVIKLDVSFLQKY